MVGYMNARADDTTGTKKDAGWEVGVRETVPVALPGVWQFLVGPGLPLWLGEVKLPLEKGARYETRDGVKGEVKSYTDKTGLRITWHPSDWPHSTVIRLMVKATVLGTTISIHHDKLADREERRMMLGHWKAVMADITRAIESRAK